MSKIGKTRLAAMENIVRPCPSSIYRSPSLRRQAWNGSRHTGTTCDRRPRPGGRTSLCFGDLLRAGNGLGLDCLQISRHVRAFRTAITGMRAEINPSRVVTEIFLLRWAQNLVEAGRRHAELLGDVSACQSGEIQQLLAALLGEEDPVFERPGLGSREGYAGSFVEGFFR